MKTDYDVIIVGGGPAGSTCAIYLSKYGYDVLLVDKTKFPRDKACGDGISGKSQSILKELGLFDGLAKIEHKKCDGAIFYSPDGIKIELNRSVGFTSKRAVYDNFLFESARKFATALEGFNITGLIFENNQVVGIKGMDADTKQEMTFKAKVVVGADGANSVVANKNGLNKFESKHRASALRIYYKNVKDLSTKFEVFFFDTMMPGYFWIFPLENNMANVGSGMLVSEMQKRKISLQDMTLKEIQNNPILAERFKDAELVEGSIKGWNLPFGSFHRKLYGNGFVLLGDAGSLIDPFTGEGIGNAMYSAKVAAQVIDEAIKANDYSERILKKYDKLLWKEIGKELKTSYMLQVIGTALLKFKWLRRFLFKKAAKKQSLINAVSAAFLYGDDAKKPSPWTLLKDLIF